MRVKHLSNHKWVQHRAITRKLTFASPLGDAIALCKADFAKQQHCNPDLVTAYLYGEGTVRLEINTFDGIKRKIYKCIQ